MKTKRFFLLLFSLPIFFVPSFGQDGMNYTDLQQYLPGSIPGYEAGEPGGSTMTMQGLSYSTADIEFTGADGAYVRVSLLDYSGAASMYQAATAMWSTGMSFEDDDTMVKSFELQDDVIGWEEYRKKLKEAQVALGIGERFFLTIEANKQNGTEFVKDIATDMDLEGLASQ
jgi:hypothetical protein